MLPTEQPDSIAPKLLSIADDQNRRVDNLFAENGRLLQALSNQVFDAQGTPVSWQTTSYLWDQLIRVSGGGFTNYNTHGWLQRIKTSWHGPMGMQGVVSDRVLVQNDYRYDVENPVSGSPGIGLRWQNRISSQDVDAAGVPVVDANNNPVLSGRTEIYSYDPLNRLTHVDYGDGQNQTYDFDAMGNRRTKTDNVTGLEGYGYDAANRLSSRAVGRVIAPYINDLNGNTLSGGGRSNTWDSQNRLVHCVSGANTCDYTYGADGQRRRSVVNGVTTDFVLDASMFVRELRGGVSAATYLTGPRGPEYRRDDTTGAVSWYLYDGLGSVLGEVAPDGTVTAKRKYDVYGLKRAGSDAGTSQHQFVGSLGHPTEDETGLIYMRARYMDPTIGRFVSEDTAHCGLNWYVYVGNRPTVAVDPKGLFGIIALDPGFGVKEEGEEAGAALNALGNISQRIKAIVETSNEIEELLVEADPVGEVGQLGRDPRKWYKAYMYFRDISGEAIKVHSFTEIVDGTVTAIANGATTPWAEWVSWPF